MWYFLGASCLHTLASTIDPSDAGGAYLFALLPEPLPCRETSICGAKLLRWHCLQVMRWLVGSLLLTSQQGGEHHLVPKRWQTRS